MLIVAIVGMIVLLQLLIQVAKPGIDRLIYRGDTDQVMWIRELDKRLLSQADLREFLENTLLALCELLRAPSGFVAVLTSDSRLQVETTYGQQEESEPLFTSSELPAVLNGAVSNGSAPANGQNGLPSSAADGHESNVLWPFQFRHGYWLYPLRTQLRDRTLGLLAVRAPTSLALSAESTRSVETLLQQAEQAIEDRDLQQNVLAAMKRIIPDIERIQKLRGTVRYVDSPVVPPLEENPITEPDFQKWVKEALRDYWGGPKLTNSPLMRLQVVAAALTENDDNRAKALRAVLARAIDRLRPAGQRQLTAAEWTLYNILDLKYIENLSAREVADRLAMSESDLYRKQRIAIEEVAHALAEMEARSGGQ